MAAPVMEGFDRDKILKQLFALPLPPPPTIPQGGGSQYNISQPLGRIMRLKGLKVDDVIRMPGSPSYQDIYKVMKGARALTPKERQALGEALQVDPRIF